MAIAVSKLTGDDLKNSDMEAYMYSKAINDLLDSLQRLDERAINSVPQFLITCDVFQEMLRSYVDGGTSRKVFAEYITYRLSERIKDKLKAAEIAQNRPKTSYKGPFASNVLWDQILQTNSEGSLKPPKFADNTTDP